jgi:hypothetical protein
MTCLRIIHFFGSGNIDQRKAFMRTKGNAASAMYAYARRIIFHVHMDGLHRASSGTFAATDAQFVLFPDAAAFALRACARWTRLSASRRIASLAQTGFKTGAKSP